MGHASRNEQTQICNGEDQANEGLISGISEDTYVHIANGNTTHFGDLCEGVGIERVVGREVEVGRVEVEESKISRHTNSRPGWVALASVWFAYPIWV